MKVITTFLSCGRGSNTDRETENLKVAAAFWDVEIRYSKMSAFRRYKCVLCLKTMSLKHDFKLPLKCLAARDLLGVFIYFADVMY